MSCSGFAALSVCVCWCLAGRVKHPSGESYVGAWQQGQRHGQGKWTSAPKAVPSKPAAASKPAVVSVSLGKASGSSKEPRETYFGGWVAGKREGHGLAEYADGGRWVLKGQWRDQPGRDSGGTSMYGQAATH